VGSRWARYVAVVGLTALVGVTIYAELTRTGSTIGLRAGERLPPFAAPLVPGGPPGDVNVAVKPNEGQAGRRPACQVRGPGVLNVCQLYERGPLVLALFIDAGSCAQVLARMQALEPSFPGVGFAAVAIKADRASLAKLVRSRRVRVPVGVDSDGILPSLFRMASCPQLTFAYPGGVVQGASLFQTPSLGALRARVAQLVRAARARGWRPPRA
jgi:hypothetical protein